MGALFRTALGVALAVFMATIAHAADYYVDVSNRTGYTIMTLQVSPDTSSSWEEDVLGKRVIGNGETHRVNLYGYSSPVFDIRATDSDGDTYTFMGVNVAARDLTITLDDIDRGDAASTAAAPDYYVEVTNRTGYTIMTLQVSPDTSSSWEEDVLGADVLPNGQSRRVNLYGYSSPIFDIRATDEDGDSYTFDDVNVALQDLTITLDDIDTGATSGSPDYYVDVTNATDYTFMFLQVSPATSKSWEEDVLGSEVMPSGTSKRVNLYGYSSPIFDIRITDEDGDTYTFFGVNVAVDDLVVTNSDLD